LTQQLINGVAIEVEYASVRDELLEAGGNFIYTKIVPDITLSEAQNLFEYLVFFAIFTHDLGKLQVKWQSCMRGWQEIAYQSFNGTNPRSYLLAHTDYNPDNCQQKQALKTYEKSHKRPNHAVESAFLAQDIFKQSLIPLLQNLTTDAEQIKYFCYVILMATGRHHSAWTKGWKTKDLAKVNPIELHPEAKRVIASSWRNLVHFLPQVVDLSPANLRKIVYPVNKEFLLDNFDVDAVEYLQLYSLVVRALRLCDQRSVS
jgi:hypothetical protein